MFFLTSNWLNADACAVASKLYKNIKTYKTCLTIRVILKAFCLRLSSVKCSRAPNPSHLSKFKNWVSRVVWMMCQLMSHRGVMVKKTLLLVLLGAVMSLMVDGDLARV